MNKFVNSSPVLFLALVVLHLIGESGQFEGYYFQSCIRLSFTRLSEQLINYTLSYGFVVWKHSTLPLLHGTLQFQNS